ncbi:MAG: hypothetical protein KKB21_03080, partial [Nanoarchaeota archaeon]|nr:hypothetical protein [Nanoarchaeota archaeon]
MISEITEEQIPRIGRIAILHAPLSETIKRLFELRVYLPSLEELAKIKMSLPRNHPANRKLIYTRHGIVTKHNSPALFFLDSLLLDKEKANDAASVNQHKGVFSIDGETYNASLAQARREKSVKSKKRIILLPSETCFPISPTDNPELYSLLFPNPQVGQDFLKFTNQQKIFIDYSNNSPANSRGALPTQLALHPLNQESVLESQISTINCHIYSVGFCPNYRKPEESELIRLLTEKPELAFQLAREELKHNPDYLSYYAYATALWTKSVKSFGSKTNVPQNILEESLENYAASTLLNPFFAPNFLLYASLL